MTRTANGRPYLRRFTLQGNARIAKQHRVLSVTVSLEGDLMDWQIGMNRAVDYIENNLSGEIDLNIASRYVGCSPWEFQRIFSFMAYVSVGEYIRRRRLAKAAADIQAGSDKIIDIALRYGYDSPASFSRAFSQLFGIAPSYARGEGALLPEYPRITFDTVGNGWLSKMENNQERGYTIRENAPVYYTPDMDRTLRWFREILGWDGNVDERSETGQGLYGCLHDPVGGFHLFAGEPVKGWASLTMIDGLEALHRHVRENGWAQLTDITEQPWGARECRVTTVDGCVLRFFEPVR
jgi:AraC family transcriptional regulator